MSTGIGDPEEILHRNRLQYVLNRVFQAPKDRPVPRMSKLTGLVSSWRYFRWPAQPFPPDC